VRDVADRFPRLDPVGPAVSGLTVPGGDVLDAIAAQAEQTDATGVRRETIDALADRGLLGSQLPQDEQRELAELLAGCDATTWFAWVQHQTPLRTLEGSVAGLLAEAPVPLRDELLPGMRSGRLLGAVAFAHVRRPGPPNPLATRVDGGWRLDGVLDWVTSWDIADVVMLMAQGDGAHTDRLVCCYLPAGRAAVQTPGLSAGPALTLLAMSGTHTRPVRLAGVHVPDDRVGAVLDRSAWLAADAVRTADANPAAFGVARGAIAELHALAEGRADDAMRDLARSLVHECRAVRAAAYSAADSGAPAPDRLALRVASLDLVARATMSVVIARSGAAMRSGCSAERRLREAMFLQVQAQTAATRSASLALMRTRALP
jgi:alkylation response protein AidB-like acyl-CoA dehydrogenase